MLGLVGLLLVAACSSLPPLAAAPGRYAGELSLQGHDRSYLIHVPPGYDGGRPLPLIILLHGESGSAQAFEEQTGFSRLADREGFIAVYPNGLGVLGLARGWNAGHCCGRAQSEGLDDVALVSELIDVLEAELAVDPDRVFVVGYDNGGMLAYRIGATLSDKVAAVAAVGAGMDARGTLAGPYFMLRRPELPVSLLAIHGTADGRLPYQGSERFVGLDAPFLATGRYWAYLDGCTPAAERRTAGGRVVEHRYTGCARGTEIRLLSLVDWGHDWPGPEATSELEASDPLHAFDAAEEIWSFLAAHPRPEPAAARAAPDPATAAQPP